MAASLPRTLVDDPEYHERAELVRQMYATANPVDAWNLAHKLRVDYVWVDEVERLAYPEGVLKFDAPQYFEQAFRNAAVTIYRVR